MWMMAMWIAEFDHSPYILAENASQTLTQAHAQDPRNDCDNSSRHSMTQGPRLECEKLFFQRHFVNSKIIWIQNFSKSEFHFGDDANRDCVSVNADFTFKSKSCNCDWPFDYARHSKMNDIKSIVIFRSLFVEFKRRLIIFMSLLCVSGRALAQLLDIFMK